MNRKPSHPGALIRNVFFPETGLTVSSLAERCGVARNTMSKVVNERGDVTGIAVKTDEILRLRVVASRRMTKHECCFTMDHSSR